MLWGSTEGTKGHSSDGGWVGGLGGLWDPWIPSWEGSGTLGSQTETRDAGSGGDKVAKQGQLN